MDLCLIFKDKYKDFLEKSPHPHPYHCFEAATKWA